LIGLSFFHEFFFQIVFEDDIYHSYLIKQYNDTAARISSNSWGALADNYDWAALDIDSFAYDYPDFLIVLSGGNFGTQGYYSLATPGHAKNSLTVGAVTNSKSSFVDSGSILGLRPDSQSALMEVNVNGLASQRFSDNYFQSSSIELVESSENCDPVSLSSSSSLEGKMVFVRSIQSNCDVNTFVLKLQQLNAQTVFLPPTLRLQGPKPTLYIPVGTLSHEDSARVQEMVGQNVTFTFPIETSTFYDSFKLPSFSSLGPTSDQRIKPDILAPGMFITSALSDGDPISGNCFGGNE
jgi:hypothetical protein